MAKHMARHMVTEDSEEEFLTDSMVRGHHIYREVWTPVVGEHLECIREEDNAEDRYAVAVIKDSTTVGHLPRRISMLCSLFIRRGGTIRCSITGHCRYSRDLVQGGMEVPCQLTFIGLGKEVKKVRYNFARDLSSKAAATQTKLVAVGELLNKRSSSSKYADETSSSSSNAISKQSSYTEESVELPLI